MKIRWIFISSNQAYVVLFLMFRVSPLSCDFYLIVFQILVLMYLVLYFTVLCRGESRLWGSEVVGQDVYKSRRARRCPDSFMWSPSVDYVQKKYEQWNKHLLNGLITLCIIESESKSEGDILQFNLSYLKNDQFNQSCGNIQCGNVFLWSLGGSRDTSEPHR